MKKLLVLVLAVAMLGTMCSFALAEDKDVPVIRALWTKQATSMPVAEMKVVKDVEKLCGIKFDVVEVPEEGSGEKINLMISSGDLPDMFMEGIDTKMVINYQDQGVFLPITKYVNEETMPNFYKILTDNPEYYAALYAPDGEIWGFPRIEEMYGLVCNQGILSINQKWLKELGLEVPTTIDEFEQCLIAFRDNDCNGNGDATDEIPFVFRVGSSGIGSWRNNQSIGQFMGCFGQADTGDRLALDKDGKVICTATTEAYKEGLKWFNKLNDEGLLWSDFALNDEAGLMSVLNNDVPKVGAVVYFSITDLLGPVRRADYTAVPYLKGPGGEYGCKDNISEMHSTVLGAVTTACKDPELACRVADAFYDPQRSVETNWGDLGGYYELDENGVMQWTKNLPPQFDSMSQYRTYCTPISFNAVLQEYYDTVVAYPEDAADLYADMTKVGFVEKHLNDKIVPPNMWYSPEDQETMSFISGEIYNLIDNYNATAILYGDVDGTWDAYITSLENAGLSQYLEIVQRTYDNYSQNLDTVIAGLEQ